MLPTINIFGKDISTYTLCAAIGLGFCILLITLLTRKRKDLYKPSMSVLCLFAGLGMLIGAHILYAFTRTDIIRYIFGHWEDFTRSWNKVFATLGELFGGMVFYGGLLGAIAGAAIYLKAKKLEFFLYADVLAPAIPLFHAFGRIGCLLGGCCYGMESSFGFHTTPHVDGVADVSRFPVQLVEACGNLLICLVLSWLSRKPVKKGTVLASYFVLYAILRFTDEFFRGDIIRGAWFGLATSQWISIILFIIGVIMLLRRYVFKGNEKFFRHLPIGTIPEGWIYQRYAGAVPPEYQHKLTPQALASAERPQPGSSQN